MAVEIISASVYSGASVDPFGNAFSHPESLEVVYPTADGEENHHIIPLMAVADVQNTFGYSEPLDAVQHIIGHSESAVAARTGRMAARGVPVSTMDIQQVNRDLFAHWGNTQQLVNEHAANMPLGDDVDKMVGDVAQVVLPVVAADAAKGAVSQVRLAASKATVSRVAASRDALMAAVEQDHAQFALEPAADGYRQLSDLLAAKGRDLARLRQDNFDIRYGEQVRGIVAYRLHQQKAQGRAEQERLLATEALEAVDGQQEPPPGKIAV